MAKLGHSMEGICLKAIEQYTEPAEVEPMIDSEPAEEGWESMKGGEMHNLEITGKFLNYAYEHIPTKYRNVYLGIVRYSVGYGEAYSRPMNQKEWAKSLRIGNKKFNSDVNWLIENGFIRCTKKRGFIETGGSAPLQYGPVFKEDFNV